MYYVDDSSLIKNDGDQVAHAVGPNLYRHNSDSYPRIAKLK